MKVGTQSALGFFVALCIAATPAVAGLRKSNDRILEEGKGKGDESKETKKLKKETKKMGGKMAKKMKKGGDEKMKDAPLNIVLSNDDGFETPLIQSLFEVLTDAGHNVIMSAPYGARSGTSGTIEFLQPLITTSEDSPGGTISAGAPGVGATTIADKQFYVDGAVTSAVLYGVDVLAPKYFGGRPDLVLCGPNEGQNTGILTPHSGTIGGTVAALNKNIPAMALSADSDEENPKLVAELSLKLIEGVVAEGGLDVLGMGGIGLNVNFPLLDAESTVEDYSFTHSEVGSAALVGLQFYEKLSDCPSAAAFGLGEVPFPGLCLSIPYFAEGSGYEEDTDPNSEFNVITNGMREVAVSVIQGTYGASEETRKKVTKVLKKVVG